MGLPVAQSFDSVEFSGLISDHLLENISKSIDLTRSFLRLFDCLFERESEALRLEDDTVPASRNCFLYLNVSIDGEDLGRSNFDGEFVDIENDCLILLIENMSIDIPIEKITSITIKDRSSRHLYLIH